jgi:hypothetical protein
MSTPNPSSQPRRWPTVLTTLEVVVTLGSIAAVGYLGAQVQNVTRDVLETVLPPTTDYTVASTVAIETLRDLARLTTLNR